MRWAAAGSSTRRSPLSKASKPIPALASWRLAHSCPLAQAHRGYGAYEHSLMNAGPHSASAKYKYQ